MKLKEICIEITSKCNLKCNGCYNQFSLDHKNRNSDLDFQKIYNIFAQANALEIPLIRLTGGEPTTHHQFNKIIHLKKEFKNIHLRVNTNAISITHYLDNIDLIDSFHISLNGIDNYHDSKWTNIPNSFELKIKNIRELKKRNKIVRIGTILTDDNINLLNHFFPIIKNLNIDHWEFYRQISSQNEESLLKNLEQICITLAYYSYQLKQKVQIANAIPFCSLPNKEILKELSAGSLYDDGNSRLIISPSYIIKPSYYLDINLGCGSNIKNAIESSYRTKLLNYEYLNEICIKCPYLEKCKGGSRYKVYSRNKTLFGQDPLMKFP